jgi:hypothetical protein
VIARGGDMDTVIITLAALFFLFLTALAGYDIGRRNLVTDIDSYGCEKVIGIYHGVKK